VETVVSELVIYWSNMTKVDVLVLGKRFVFRN
jgi:hypothetical protein